MRRRVPFFLACATVAICGLVVIAKALLDRKPRTRSLPGIGRLEYCAFADGETLDALVDWMSAIEESL
jgi:hypothetical protein